MRSALRITITVIAGLALVGIGAGIGSAGHTSASPKPAVTRTITAPTVTVSPVATVTATVTIRPKRPKPPSNTLMTADGVYVVGRDILPGTYVTSGASASSGGQCYYALLSSTNTSDIIDNNIVSGRATITVSSGVAAVDTEGCNTWHRISA